MTQSIWKAVSDVLSQEDKVLETSTQLLTVAFVRCQIWSCYICIMMAHS